MHVTQVIGGVHLHMHVCARADVPPFPYFGNCLTDCPKIWCVVRGPLARLFAYVNGVAQLHVRTPFSYLGNGWTDCAESGMWLETH